MCTYTFTLSVLVGQQSASGSLIWDLLLWDTESTM